MATLEQFLRTGELGPIRPGMREAEVIAILGPPPDESVAKQNPILKYGGLQLTFVRYPGAAEPELSHVGLYFGPRTEPIPELARPTDFDATAETSFAGMREFLSRTGLNQSAAFPVDSKNHVFFPSGARITFDGDMLHSVIFVTRKGNPPQKQVSISLDEDTWKLLNRLARQSNLSVSQLCSEWIAQRASEGQHNNATSIGTRG